ncbi:unnamed protein product [Albugo candida]|uniref:Uncharacterized protein n=1 Tax=Albugo candida TaxID=65357 RepID=A0A024FWQ4_9STRA|nr:unnamed protein product [Albugo candida]|eukprot:CCI11530.1 unnamed protein product [Albugo candida]
MTFCVNLERNFSFSLRSNYRLSFAEFDTAIPKDMYILNVGRSCAKMALHAGFLLSNGYNIRLIKLIVKNAHTILIVVVPMTFLLALKLGYARRNASKLSTALILPFLNSTYIFRHCSQTVDGLTSRYRF